MYTLVRVNGQPVPYVISQSRLYGDTTTILEVRWKTGSIVMFAAGRLDWSLTSDFLFNGHQRESIPPHVNHYVGAYVLDQQTLHFRDLEGTVLDGGRTLSFKDQMGGYDFATFEFERRQ